jgi:DNA-binding NarL/FixJ family response regulator
LLLRTGINLVRKVHATHPELHVIVLTASRREQQHIAPVRAGVRVYLSKSVSVDV